MNDFVDLSTGVLGIGGVAHQPSADLNDAQQAVISAARRLRKARADWDLGCPDSLQPYYHALNAALTALDAMEQRS